MINEGTSAAVSFTADEGATAVALGSGDVPVLGTPKIVALVEAAAVAALAGALPDGATSVGTNIAVDHLAPTRIGGTVVAEATITAVDDRRVSFAVRVTEGDAVVARGTHVRFVVDRKRFLGG
jgi:predicted thioesterase